jgi:isoquinoline 1-oxidoreductase alpha subunit
MSAAALLARNPQPTDSDIGLAMDGNLCRCSTYPRIRRAIHLAASMMSAVATGSGVQTDRINPANE